MLKETKRQLVHLLFFLVIFFTKYLSFWQTLLLLAFCLVVVIIFGPRERIKNHFYRQEEKKYSQGAIYYFLTLVFLFLVFPLPVFAGAWAVLALGDGAATIIGAEFGKSKIQWNHKKSWLGSVSFFIFASAGLAVTLQWFGVLGLSPLKVLFVALAAAIVESLPWKINDNISVPIVSAVFLSLLFA